MDHNGYIRLNVKGREREGTVEPSEIDTLCAELRDALMSFHDIESGAPVVEDVVRIDDVLGAEVPRRAVLPDLVVLWTRPASAQQSSGVTSRRFGEIRWPKGARFRSGRSGNHTHHGWFVATGPGLEAGRSAGTYDTIDLLPTAFEWLGAAQPDFFHGRPIAELTGRSVEVKAPVRTAIP